jgi:predicted RNA-binding Zn-ribbon protein involved in translation (DUF1610 family)
MSTQIITDDNYKLPCISPEHNPPSHIVIPSGSKLVHTCPGCGQVTVIRPNIVTCKSPDTLPYVNIC